MSINTSSILHLKSYSLLINPHTGCSVTIGSFPTPLGSFIRLGVLHYKLSKYMSLQQCLCLSTNTDLSICIFSLVYFTFLLFPEGSKHRTKKSIISRSLLYCFLSHPNFIDNCIYLLFP